MSTNSSGMFAAFNAALEQVQRQKMQKMASDGFDTSMPADGEDNNTQEPKTGDTFSAMSKDLKDAPFMEGTVESDPDASLTADNQDAHSWVTDTRLYEADDKDNDYKFSKTDPGTSMPAEAGNCDKYASYTIHEHHRSIEKIASFLLDCIEARQDYRGKMAKQASAKTSNQPQENPEQTAHYNRMQKLAMIVNEAENDADLFIANANGVLQKMAEGEAITDELPVDAAAMDDTAAAEATDAAVADLAAGDAAGNEALASLSPEDQEILSSMSDEELVSIIQDIAQEDPALVEEALGSEGAAMEDEGAALEDAAAAVPDAEKMASYAYAYDSLSDADRADLNRASNQELYNLIMLNERVKSGSADIDAVDKAVVSEQIKEAAYNNYALQMQKLAEADAAADEALADLSQDELAALASLDDDELMSLINEVESGEGGDLSSDEEAPDAEEDLSDDESEELLDSMAGDDEEEAINELSSAMTEEGIAPEDLAAMGKEGSAQRLKCYKLACAVKAYRDAGRYQYTEPKTQKRAHARALYRSALQTLNEYTN